LCGPKVIAYLKKRQQAGQPIRLDGPESHIITKSGTPTMGGVMIIGNVLLSILLWADLTNGYVWILLFTMCSFAFIGFLDDFYKLKHRDSEGIKARSKLLLQCVFGILIDIGIIIYSKDYDSSTGVVFPFLKNTVIHLGWMYPIFSAVVITGSSNATNLTDGLDGLLIGPVIIVSVCLTLIAYLVGNSIFASYLQLYYVQGAGELCIVSASMIGAGLGFLWYNTPPAKIFMGDVGSLSLGAMIGVISIITKHELVLVILGGLFVIEALSVIIQVASYKLRRKRVFKMAPIHHHFEKLGWSESTIVIRFWIIAVLFALLGLATLKLR